MLISILKSILRKSLRINYVNKFSCIGLFNLFSMLNITVEISLDVYNIFFIVKSFYFYIWSEIINTIIFEFTFTNNRAFEKSLLKKYLSAIILLINCSSFWATSRGSFSILISQDTLCKAIFSSLLKVLIILVITI